MIIDLILDRRDDLKHGIDNYDPREFYQDIVAYEDNFKGLGQAISIALDTGEEEDVKAALKQYIDDQEYNEDIKDFIDSVSWLNEDIDGATEYGGELVSAKTKIKEVTKAWETETKQQITGKVLLDAIVDGLNNDEDFVLFMQALYQSIDTFVSSFTQEGSSSYLTVGFVDTLSLEQIEELGSAYYYYDHNNVIKPTDNPMELFLDTAEYREHVEKALDTLLSLYSGDYTALYNDKKELYELEDDDGFLYQFLPSPDEFGITEDLTWAKEAHEGKNMNDFEKTIGAPVALSNEQLIELAGYLFEAAVEGNEMFSDNPGLDLVENLASWTGIEISLLKDMFDGYIYDEADDDIDSDVLPPNGIDEPILETNQLKEKHGAPLDTSKRPKVRRVKHWHSFLEEFGVDEGHYDFYCKKGDFFIAQTEPKTLIHLGAVDTVAFNTKDEPVKLEDIGLDRDFLLRMEK